MWSAVCHHPSGGDNADCHLLSHQRLALVEGIRSALTHAILQPRILGSPWVLTLSALAYKSHVPFTGWFRALRVSPRISSVPRSQIAMRLSSGLLVLATGVSHALGTLFDGPTGILDNAYDVIVVGGTT